MAAPLDDASAILIEQLSRGEDPEYAASRALAEELAQEDLARVSRDEDRLRVDARIAFDLYRDRRAPPVALRTRRRSCADSKKLGALILGTIVDAIPNMFSFLDAYSFQSLARVSHAGALRSRRLLARVSGVLFFNSRPAPRGITELSLAMSATFFRPLQTVPPVLRGCVKSDQGWVRERALTLAALHYHRAFASAFDGSFHFDEKRAYLERLDVTYGQLEPYAGVASPRFGSAERSSTPFGASGDVATEI
jgi:hypothetical protein